MEKHGSTKLIAQAWPTLRLSESIHTGYPKGPAENKDWATHEGCMKLKCILPITIEIHEYRQDLLT